MKKLLLFLSLFSGFQIMGQSINIDQAVKKPYKPKLGGSLNLNASYNSFFLDKKVNVFASGNLNLGINQFNIPVNFSYSDRKFNFSQAYNFNQLSIRPTYKWASATIGTANLNFSPYTLNGHQFLGAGFELKPNNWDVKLMYGRLIKASPIDSVAGHSFRRMGAGSKVSYRFNEQLKLGASFFYANDAKNSLKIEDRNFLGQTINPNENLVLSLDFLIRPLPFLEWKGEVANSLLTENTNEESSDLKIKSANAIFLNENSSSRSMNAFKTEVNVRPGNATTLIGLGYERIDPDYRTLGGYYFVNDLENYTFHFSTNLWENKLALFSRLGIQKDDLDNQKSTSQNRWVGSLNATVRPTDKTNLNLSITNFKAFMFVKDAYQEITSVPDLPIDSLDYSQVSRSLNIGLNQLLSKSEDRQNSLRANFSIIQAEGRNGPVIRNETVSDILNASLWYSMRFVKQSMSFNAGLAFNQNKYDQGVNKGIGPSLSLQKALLDNKMRTSLNTSLLFSKNNDRQLNALNVFWNASYTPVPRQNLVFNLGYIRNGLGANYTNANLGYTISF